MKPGRQTHVLVVSYHDLNAPLQAHVEKSALLVDPAPQITQVVDAGLDAAEP